MQTQKSPEQEPGGPAPATRGRPLFSTRTSTPFPSVFSPSSSYFSPFHSSILHSLHVLFPSSSLSLSMLHKLPFLITFHLFLSSSSLSILLSSLQLPSYLIAPPCR